MRVRHCINDCARAVAFAQRHRYASATGLAAVLFSQADGHSVSDVWDDDQLCAYGSISLLRSLHDATVWDVGVRVDGAADSVIARNDATARAVDESADGAWIERGDVCAAGAVSGGMGVQDLGYAVS